MAAEPAPAVSGIPVGVEEVPRESLAALLADSCPFLFQFLKLPWREGNCSLFLARLHHAHSTPSRHHAAAVPLPKQLLLQLGPSTASFFADIPFLVPI